MTCPGQSVSVTLSRCSLWPSQAAIRAASCDPLALLPGLRIHGARTRALCDSALQFPRALSGSRAAFCAPRCPHTPGARTRCPHTMCPPSGTSRRVHAAAPLYPALQGARTPHACARRSLSGRRPPRVAFVHVPRQDMFILAGRRRIGQRPAHQVQHGPCAVWPALARRWRALSIPTWSHRVPT